MVLKAGASGGARGDTDISLFWLWAKADEQRLGLLPCLWAAAAAADQPSFRGLTPFGLAPLRSAAQRGINSPIGCLLGGSGGSPKNQQKVESLFICFSPQPKKGNLYPCFPHSTLWALCTT